MALIQSRRLMPHRQTPNRSPVHVINCQRHLCGYSQLIGYPGFGIKRIRIVGEQRGLLRNNQAKLTGNFQDSQSPVGRQSNRHLRVVPWTIHASIAAASGRPVATAGAAAVDLPIPCATRVRSKMLTTPSRLISTGELGGTRSPNCCATLIKSRILTTPSRFTSPGSSRS